MHAGLSNSRKPLLNRKMTENSSGSAMGGGNKGNEGLRKTWILFLKKNRVFLDEKGVA
jgi:hypothetical protein